MKKLISNNKSVYIASNYLLSKFPIDKPAYENSHRVQGYTKIDLITIKELSQRYLDGKLLINKKEKSFYNNIHLN